MGRATKKRLEERAAQDRKLVEALVSRRQANNKTHRETLDPLHLLPQHAYDFLSRRVRDCSDWVYRGKSRKKEKQVLDLIRHMFALYPVPYFLEKAFIEGDKNHSYVDWYLAAAQGESLYKTCTRGILSKKETHFLLRAPNELSIKEAIWWAKTMTISNDIGIAYRMARCGIVRRGEAVNEFWVDVHRFFTNNPISLKEMDELLDYIVAEHRENNNWTIKKRSLESIRRKSEEWHRAQVKMRNIGGGRWDGMMIPSWTYETGTTNPNYEKDTRVEWSVFQILTGNELAREGQRMRHCVSAYKRSCMDGRCAIFSMRSNTVRRQDQRHLTIEVISDRRQVIQAVGVANRPPRPQEKEILKRWAHDNGLTINTWHTRY